MSYDLKNNRMLCWDDFLIDRVENAEVRMHKPIKREKVFTCDQAWEGNCCGYGTLMKLGDVYRFYYRAQHSVPHPDKTISRIAPSFCVAESRDLKSFQRMPVNKIAFDGVVHNNIYYNNGGRGRDNFAVIYDENPNCPREEKFKALAMGGGTHSAYAVDGGPEGLYLFVSENGIDFKPKGRLPLDGSFDSYNIMFWDRETEQYYFYYRGERTVDGGQEAFDVEHKSANIFREVRMSTSKDLIHFEHYGELNYGEDNIPMQFYTNQIEKYYRAKDMFIGFPARYIERWGETENISRMPLAEQRAFMTENWGRAGTAFTDCTIITSRDGYHFKKWDEAYLTPGIESRNNWWYGNCYTVYGMQETESDTEGAPNEISFLMPDCYRIKALEYYRYTTRLDGFFSWYAKYSGGEVLTKPFTFEGDELEINFSSSALGSIEISICDENGNEIEGYKGNKIFGDSVDRKVCFKKDLQALKGIPVRLKIYLQDCDLYSFKFN